MGKIIDMSFLCPIKIRSQCDITLSKIERSRGTFQIELDRTNQDVDANLKVHFEEAPIKRDATR